MAATWFPVNDHPTDKASYTFHVTVPRAREVIANGHLVSKRTNGGWSTWTYDAPSPMASYLATVDVGDWNFTPVPEGRAALPRRIGPEPVRPGGHPVDRHPVRHLSGSRPDLQEADARHQRPRGRSHRRLHHHPQHRTRLGLRLRRGAHRRTERLDDAARPQRAHQPGHRQLLRPLAGHAPVHLVALPDLRPDRRDLRSHRRYRSVVGRHRRGRRAGAVAGRPLGVRRPQRRALHQLRQRRLLPAPRSLRR